MLNELEQGRGSVLMLEGPAGIGKTEMLRLAPAMASELQLNALQAKGGELERDFPYGVVRQLLEPPLARAEPAEQERLLAGAAGRARIVLRRERRTTAHEGSPQEGLDAVLHGLYWLTVNLSEQAPLLLVVDDVHWADRSTQDFLAYLARRLEDLPIALLLASRTGEEEPSEQLRHIGSGSHVLELPPLSEEAVGELAARLGNDVSREFASACSEVTAGNPYLMRELLSALAEAGVRPDSDAADRVRGFAPRTVARSVLTRVAALSPAAERLARAVALLGRDAELRHGAQLAGLDEAEAATAADALVAASILIPGRPLDFVHPLVRSAIYADLPPAQRGIDHRRAAELLAAEGADPEHVSTHLLAAEPAADKWVVEQLRAAAARVMAEGAPEAAVRYLLALALSRRPNASAERCSFSWVRRRRAQRARGRRHAAFRRAAGPGQGGRSRCRAGAGAHRAHAGGVARGGAGAGGGDRGTGQRQRGSKDETRCGPVAAYAVCDGCPAAPGPASRRCPRGRHS